jgi:hypothetical protein
MPVVDVYMWGGISKSQEHSYLIRRIIKIFEELRIPSQVVEIIIIKRFQKRTGE